MAAQSPWAPSSLATLFPAEFSVLQGLLTTASLTVDPARAHRDRFLSTLCNLCYEIEAFWCGTCSYLMQKIVYQPLDVRQNIRKFCQDMDRAVLSCFPTSQQLLKHHENPSDQSLPVDFDPGYNFAALEARFRDALALFAN
jgi:hypothetical protein